MNTNIKEKEQIEGRRIVDINHLVQQIAAVKHASSCTKIDIIITKENKIGFFSVFDVFCETCHTTTEISSEPRGVDKTKIINITAVSVIVSTGGGYSSLNEISAALNMPTN